MTKPKLHLARNILDPKVLAALYEKLTGKKPTEDEMRYAREQLAKVKDK